MSELSVKELEGVYDQVDAEIAKSGLPTEEDLKKEIEVLNKD